MKVAVTFVSDFVSDLDNKILQVMFGCVEQKDKTYLPITVRVHLAVRVTSGAGISTPGRRTANLSRAGLIGVTLLLFLGRP